MNLSLSKLAFKNLVRKPVRSIAIVIIAALAAGLVFGSTTVLHAVRGSLVLGMERLGADIMIVPKGYEAKGRKVLLAGEPTSFYMERKNFDALAGIQGIEKASPQLFMTSAVLMCCSMPNVLLVGFEPATDFTLAPWVRYAHVVSKKALPEVTIGAQTLYASEGPHMTFYGTMFKIGRSLHPTGMGFLDYSIFMTMDAAHEMIVASKTKSPTPLKVSPDQISSVLVKVASAYDIHHVAEDIEKRLPGVKALVTQDMITAVRRDSEIALWGIMASGIAFWFLMLILLGLVFAMSVNERGRELGLLRAMGANQLHVFRLILSEAMLLTGTGAAAGIGLAGAIIFSFKKLIIASLGNVQFLWPSITYIAGIAAACFALMLVSGVVSALYPAIKTCRREPYEAICMAR